MFSCFACLSEVRLRRFHLLSKQGFYFWDDFFRFTRSQLHDNSDTHVKIEELGVAGWIKDTYIFAFM